MQTIEYKIQNGDTLWTIASQFNSTNYEKFIYIVKNLNNLDESTLLVDQVLILPSNI
jgi:LysM repeat protein